MARKDVPQLSGGSGGGGMSVLLSWHEKVRICLSMFNVLVTSRTLTIANLIV